MVYEAPPISTSIVSPSITLLTDAAWVWADAAINDLVTGCTVALTDGATVAGIPGIVGLLTRASNCT